VRNEKKPLTRRQFIGYGLAAGAALAGLRLLTRLKSTLRVRGHAPCELKKGLVIIHGNADGPGEEAEVVRSMTRAAMDALGGMHSLVQRGQRVVIKPNIAWVRPAEFAANTNPHVVAALVEMCLEAGARRVSVMDRTIASDPRRSYEASGIGKAAAEAGADVAYVEEGRFVELEVPDGFALKRWLFCEEFVSARTCDVLINVPVLKHHGTTRLTIGLKNALGMVGGERGDLHRRIHEKIPDLHRVLRVDLTVVDAYRVLRRHGPTGGRLEDVDNSIAGARRIIASTDPVAADACAASLFELPPGEPAFIGNAERAGLGMADWQSVLVEEGSV